MRIFVLGTGATGALLAQLLARQGHQVTCGDRDPQRARRYLGKESPLEVVPVNARNLRAIVRAARGCHLLVNASPAVVNEIVLRAALRLRAHYLDLAAHMTRNPFQAEQFRYDERFKQKRRTALATAGVAPGLTNLLAERGAEMVEEVESVHIRLYENTESDDPVSQWSAEGSFDEAISRPRIIREGRFRLAKRFGEPERFRFPAPIGVVTVVLFAQDEIGTLPRSIHAREMNAKIGGNEVDRLRRWNRQGKLQRSRRLVASRFPHTATPKQIAVLLRHRRLQNARFAAAVIVRGRRGEEFLEIRFDAGFPTLHQLRRQGLTVTPIANATARMAALFVRRFPRGLHGVYVPNTLPVELRQAILGDVRQAGITIRTKVTTRKPEPSEEETES